MIWKQQVKDSEADDLVMKKMFPKREEYQWRPSPVLCKRFDLIDPYMGKVVPCVFSLVFFICLFLDLHYPMPLLAFLVLFLFPFSPFSLIPLRKDLPFFPLVYPILSPSLC